MFRIPIIVFSRCIIGEKKCEKESQKKLVLHFSFVEKELLWFLHIQRDLYELLRALQEL